MSAYGAATTPHHDRDEHKRERALSLLAGLLGVLMFIWGFLKWLNTGDSSGHTDQRTKYAGYAFGMPTTAVIALSLAAGLVAALGALDRRRGRGVPSAIPTGLALTSFLLALGILLGKGSISPDEGAKVGVEVGLILGLVTAAVQTVVLAVGLAGRKDDPVGRPADYGPTTGTVR